MRTSETLRALEAHFITEAEALEQAMVDSLDELHEKVASEAPNWRPSQRHLGAHLR